MVLFQVATLDGCRVTSLSYWTLYYYHLKTSKQQFPQTSENIMLERSFVSNKKQETFENPPSTTTLFLISARSSVRGSKERFFGIVEFMAPGADGGREGHSRFKSTKKRFTTLFFRGLEHRNLPPTTYSNRIIGNS